MVRRCSSARLPHRAAVLLGASSEMHFASSIPPRLSVRDLVFHVETLDLFLL